MKKLLLTSLLVMAGVANAAITGYADNESGGQMIFTNDTCVYKSTGKVVPDVNYVLTTTKDGKIAYEGCYQIVGKFIVVNWWGVSEPTFLPFSNIEIRQPYKQSGSAKINYEI